MQHQRRLLLQSLLLASAIPAWAKPAPTPAVNLPPPAELLFSIKARQNGVPLSGRSKLVWRADSARYLAVVETSALLVGKILDERSEGSVSSAGLVPNAYTEKRFRKEATTTRFDRPAGLIRFGESQATQKLQGNEQDRASAMWQLIAVARAEKRPLKPGLSWRFMVAGQRDADPWIFTLQARERLGTALGDLDTVHIARLPPENARERKLELWLAPGMDWYPVRMRFEDGDDEYIEQFIEDIKRQ